MMVTGNRILSWLREDALPLWSSAGLDGGAGGFFDDLTADGDPLQNAPKRLRVQARQIYVFSHAHLLGWIPAPGSGKAAGCRVACPAGLTALHLPRCLAA